MSMQWYPGHMTKARRLIAEAMPNHDVVIEVLDARMPEASANPVLAELCGAKPRVRVLTKSDLADERTTSAWIDHMMSRPSPGPIVALAISQKRPADVRTRVEEACLRLCIHRTSKRKIVRAMVVGIPNVGKSTLINTLMNRKVAKVGDEPAVTKGQQTLTLPSGIIISDNPGILWPKIEDGDASMRLALGGAMSDNAIEYELVALFGLGFLLAECPAALRARYKLAETPASPNDALVEIGRRRGCLRAGGNLDRHKAADVVIHDFRDGSFGPISLERPPLGRGAQDSAPEDG